MSSLKKSVDASTIPEQTLRGVVAQMATGEIDSTDIYLSVVYRVEVSRDEIVIWTILNTSPDGTYDFDAKGVLLTPGTPSGVPLSELSNLATLIFFSLVFFNFLAHATQSIGLSSVRTLAYTFQTIELFYMQW